MLKSKLVKLKLSSSEKLYFGFLTAIVILPIVAPILSSLGLHSVSKYIYFVYSFFCHQFDTRSIHFHDYQYAWCARDVGIWIGILIASIAYYKNYLPKIKWYYIIFFIVPIALDGGIQTISTFGSLNVDGGISGNVYASNNLFRFLTGSWFGIGVGLWVSQYFLQSLNVKNFKFSNNSKQLITVFAICTVAYVVSILTWSFTSNKFKPTNILDSEPKIQRDDFFQRRAHGECPTESSTDLVNWDCFFS